MFCCRILLVALLSWLTVPECMRLTSGCLDTVLADSSSEQDHQLPIPEMPAPCDGDEAQFLTDGFDDHEGSPHFLVEFHPLWRPALSAGSRGFYATARDLFDWLHRLRI